jgi:hypothetical protein
MAREAFGDELLKMLPGSVQFIPVVVYCPEKVVPISYG